MNQEQRQAARARLALFHALTVDDERTPADWLVTDLAAALDALDAMEAVLRAILYHDERGQGVGYAETMEAARALLPPAQAEG